MTVLDNLHRKGLVTRERSGRAYLYSAAQSEREYTGARMAAAAEEADDRIGALMHFVAPR